MKQTLLLSEKDKNNYKEEISNMLIDIIPNITSFYNKFGVTLNGITYNSTLDFQQTTKISFDITSSKFYPSLVITLSNAGSAFRTPNKRILHGSFTIKGISDTFVNTLYTDHGISQIITVKSDASGNIKDKINQLIDKTNESIDEWSGYANAAEIFIF